MPITEEAAFLVPDQFGMKQGAEWVDGPGGVGRRQKGVIVVVSLLAAILLMAVSLHASPLAVASLPTSSGPEIVIKAAALDNNTFWNKTMQCADGKDVDAALDEMDQGDVGYYSAQRDHFLYMKQTWCALKALNKSAETIVDVGSSWPPFLRSVDWVKHRTTVSLYFPGSTAICPDDKGEPWYHNQTDCRDPKSDIHVFMADFYNWQPKARADLVVCSQVIEHVPNPVSFLRKLRITADLVVMSVPYLWDDYTLDFHLSHYIDKTAIRQWAGGDELYSFVVTEANGTFASRVVMVFQGLSSPSPSESMFQRIPNGTCADAGMMPITHHRTCAAAAEALSSDISFTLTGRSGHNNPAGCNFNGSVVLFGEKGGIKNEPLCVSKYAER